MGSMGYSQGDEIALFNPSYPPKKGVVKKITPSGQIVVESKGAVTCTHRFTNRGYEVGESRSWSRNFWFIEPKPKAAQKFATETLAWAEKNFFAFVTRELEAIGRRPRKDRTFETRQEILTELTELVGKLEQQQIDILRAEQVATNPDVV